MNIIESERLKYQKAWAIDGYDHHSPGEEISDLFKEIALPIQDETIIDLGTGSGRGALALAKMGLDVTVLDLTFDGLDKRAEGFRKIEASLWGAWNAEKRGSFHIPLNWDYGYCTDVMEHIPPEYVMLTLHKIMLACDKAFFHICLIPDGFGQLVGEPLHLTVMPFEWWRDHLGEIGTVLESRDFMNNGIFYVER